MKSAALLILLCAMRLCAQQNMFAGARDSLSLPLTSRDSVIDLHHQFILHGTETIYIDSLRLPDNAYSLDSRHGKLIITDTHFRIADTLHPRHLRIAYSYLPFSFKDMYAHRELAVQNDSVYGTEKVAVQSKSEPLTMENIFGPNFQKSGTLIRGLTIGTNQDVTVTSGFHMQFSGKVTNDVEVVGSLTDDNTPIQPEGNTQTIQELDKIFVQINAPAVSGTLGDFDTKLDGTEFANISRKVEGGEALGHSDIGSVQVIAATTRGKYNTNQFNGLDGVQGPYILTGANGENNVIVIAGTEHVYVDGIAQQRGENLDYIIDYSTAQVTFQARRLITSASRITIDFQYSDQQFARSLLAARAVTTLGKDTSVRISATYMREGDNQDAPLSITLSDTAKQILAQAGGDRNKASYSGVNYAGTDSVTHIGKGFYIRHDTVINGKPDSVFIYAPGDTNALYTVSFTFVGAGQGTYNNVAGLQYQYVGAGNGSYVPVVYLPMPTLAQIADTRVAVALAKSVTATGEFAYSSFSLNRFSALPDASTTGTAGSFGLQFSPEKFSFGSLQAGIHARSLSPLFHPIDRIDDIEFNRNWNLPADAVNQKQNIYEGNVTYSPVEQVALNADIGELQSGSLFSTSRQQYSFATKNVRSLTANYQFQILHSAGLVGVSSSDWTRQYGDASYTLGILTPGVHYESESKKELGFAVDSLGNPLNATGAGDTLDQNSYRYTLVQPRLRIAPTSNFAVYGSYNFRTDDSIRNDAFTRQSSSQGAGGGVEIHNLGGVNSTVDVTVLNKTVEPAFYATSGTNNQSLAMRMQTNVRELSNFITGDLYYEASTQRAAKLQKRFVLVPYGTGQYIYLGDLNHNGVQDEDEFQLTVNNDGIYTLVYVPTDQLYPVIDLKTSERVRLTPHNLFSKPSGDLETILSALSSETYTRIEEHSTTPDIKDIYLLHFSKFLDPAYTLNGSQQFQQDLFILENNSEFSIRARYSQNRSLTQYATTDEQAYQSEQSLRIRWHLVQEITSEIDVARSKDNLAAIGASVNTPRQLTTDLFESDLSYRPVPEIEAGWKLTLKTTTDAYVAPNVTANKDYNNIHVTYSFAGKGQLRGEVERDEVILGPAPQGYITSFQLTDGFETGQTYIARATFEYRVTANVQASATYIGRLHQLSLPVHTFQAEVRALF